jgi:hypothetical protein
VVVVIGKSIHIAFRIGNQRRNRGGVVTWQSLSQTVAVWQFVGNLPPSIAPQPFRLSPIYFFDAHEHFA